jgi:hypothetical protein
MELLDLVSIPAASDARERDSPATFKQCPLELSRAHDWDGNA